LINVFLSKRLKDKTLTFFCSFSFQRTIISLRSDFSNITCVEADVNTFINFHPPAALHFIQQIAATDINISSI
ncbi:hypothetical protein, partial [Bacillus sp. JJ1474]|uniref:hypothetical protein n=1 Tax=Bacillus sp. JJ1474 TaxID=3122955 RepID=UPI002FFD7118